MQLGLDTMNPILSADHTNILLPSTNPSTLPAIFIITSYHKVIASDVTCLCRVALCETMWRRGQFKMQH